MGDYAREEARRGASTAVCYYRAFSMCTHIPGTMHVQYMCVLFFLLSSVSGKRKEKKKRSSETDKSFEEEYMRVTLI